MKLRPAVEHDFLAISILLDTAFEGPAEARLVQRLREAGDMALELVAEDESGVLGYIAFCKLLAPEGIWSLSPVAVRQSAQGAGVGADLIRYGLDAVRQSHEARGIVVLGAPKYYERFGFSLKAAQDLTTPFAKENTLFFPITADAGHLQAALSYPKAFSEDE